jgi:diacylglycerol kinase
MAVLPRSALTPQEDYANPPTRKAPRPWRHKFGDALRGLKLGIRGHSSFSVHFFFAVLIIAGASVLGCSVEQWLLLLGCIGMVLTAELFNSALETLVRGLDESARQRVGASLDIAAGAVLLASITAAIIGTAIFATILLRQQGIF